MAIPKALWTYTERFWSVGTYSGVPRAFQDTSKSSCQKRSEERF